MLHNHSSNSNHSHWLMRNYETWQTYSKAASTAAKLHHVTMRLLSYHPLYWFKIKHQTATFTSAAHMHLNKRCAVSANSRMCCAHQPSELINFEVTHLLISVGFRLKLAGEATSLVVSAPHRLHGFRCLLKDYITSLCSSPPGPLPLMSVWHGVEATLPTSFLPAPRIMPVCQLWGWHNPKSLKSRCRADAPHFLNWDRKTEVK